MRDDEFQKVMDTWAESEIESAPDLRPSAEMVRLVRAKLKPRRAFPLSSRWAVSGAAVASLFLIVALFALILWSGIVPGWEHTPEATFIAQREGPIEVQTTIVKGEGKVERGKGPGRGPAAFRRLMFEIQRQDSPVVQAVDLLSPPEEILVLTPVDNYRLVLEPVQECHVRVYQLTSYGSLVQLFPNPAYSDVPDPLQAGQSTPVPAEPNWLYLDGTPGEERLYVIGSPQPLQALDDLYAQYTQGLGAASKREPLSALLALIETIVTQPDRTDVVEFVFQHR